VGTFRALQKFVGATPPNASMPSMVVMMMMVMMMMMMVVVVGPHFACLVAFRSAHSPEALNLQPHSAWLSLGRRVSFAKFDYPSKNNKLVHSIGPQSAMFSAYCGWYAGELSATIHRRVMMMMTVMMVTMN
jgi:hypothetical protein